MKKNQLRHRPVLLLLVVVVITALSVLPGCNPKTEKSTKLKIGVVLPLTGDLSFYGQLVKNSFAMTVDTSKIDFIIEDSRGDVKDAITIVNKFINVDKIDILVSFLPPICEAVNPICIKNKVLHFAFTQSPAIAENGYTLKYWADSDDEAHMFIRYILQCNPKKVAFLRHLYPDADLAFHTISKPTLDSAKIDILDMPFDLATKDFKNFAAKISGYNPDIVVVQTLAYNYKNILTNLKNMNLSGKMIADLNYYNVKDLNDFQDKSYEHIPFVCMKLITNDTYQTYLSDYKKRFGKETTVFGVFAYDLGSVLNKLDKKDLSKQHIIDYYNNNEVNGYGGRIIFDKSGNLKIKYSISQFVQGKVVDYDQTK